MHPSLIIVRTHIGFGSPKQDSPPAMASRWVVKHWRLPKKKPAGRRKCSMYLLRLKNILLLSWMAVLQMKLLGRL